MKDLGSVLETLVTNCFMSVWDAGGVRAARVA